MRLLPTPQKVAWKEGSFRLSGSKIVLAQQTVTEDFFAAQELKKEIVSVTGQQPLITKSLEHPSGQIYLENTKKGGEGYRLEIAQSGVHLLGDSSAGLFYAVQTLKQILRQAGVELPCLTIEDMPQFSDRGYYFDISRGRVPKLETIKWLVDQLSAFKVNQFQLYIEHTFMQETLPGMYAGNAYLTPEEILELDVYCIQRHVELVPSMASFGHLYEVLQCPEGRPYCELADYKPAALHVLERGEHHTADASNPATAQFITRLIDDYLPLFSSRKFNICCDETKDLGKGRSACAAAEKGPGRLYVDFLNQLAAHVKKRGKQPMFWGDIILKYPELLSEVEPDAIVLHWDYAPSPSYEDAKRFHEAGRAMYLCPGIASWLRLLPYYRRGYANIKKMAAYAAEFSARGILNTDWGDLGHPCHIGPSLPGLVYGAEQCWNQQADTPDEEIDKGISHLVYGDETGEIMKLFHQLGEANLVFLWNHFVMWVNWKQSGAIRQEEDYTKVEAQDGLIHLFNPTELCASLKNMQGEKSRNAYQIGQQVKRRLEQFSCTLPKERTKQFDQFRNAAEGVCLMAALGQTILLHDFRAGGEDLLPPSELGVRLDLWLDEFCRIWRKDNLESDLGDIVAMVKQTTSWLKNLE